MRLKLALAVTLLTAAGCAKPAVITTGDGKRQVVDTVKQETVDADKQLIVEGRNRGDVKLLTVQESRPNGYLRLQIGFQNRAGDDRQIQFEVHYFDEKGLPIMETTGWTPLEIPARGAKYASVTSIRREAASYKVHMMYQ
jgi:uncharacterized protein YcfL